MAQLQALDPITGLAHRLNHVPLRQQRIRLAAGDQIELDLHHVAFDDQARLGAGPQLDRCGVRAQVAPAVEVSANPGRVELGGGELAEVVLLVGAGL